MSTDQPHDAGGFLWTTKPTPTGLSAAIDRLWSWMPWREGRAFNKAFDAIYGGAQDDILSVLQEVDRLQRKIAYLEDTLDPASGPTSDLHSMVLSQAGHVHDLKADLADMTRERDAAVARAGKAERERDNADQRCAVAESERDKWKLHHDRVDGQWAKAEREVTKLRAIERERDEWKARAEAAEARTAPAVTVEHRDAVADHLWNAMVGSAKSVVRDVVAQAFVAAGIEVAVEAEAAADPVVIFMRESDLPAARVDGDDYLVKDPKGDYRWPKHGASWWEDRAQDALTKAARFTALARLAAREAVVGPVEAKARELWEVARFEDGDEWSGLLQVERDCYRRMAAHVLGQEADQ